MGLRSIAQFHTLVDLLAVAIDDDFNFLARVCLYGCDEGFVVIDRQAADRRNDVVAENVGVMGRGAAAQMKSSDRSG